MNNSYLVFALFFALIWGFVWAACLQYTRWGRWLALYRTWITVVIGVGVDLAILALVFDFQAWRTILAIFALSAVGIITRSLINEYKADADEISTR